MGILEKLENARKIAEADGDMQSAAGYTRAIQHVRSLQEGGTPGRGGQHPSYEEGVALLGDELRRKQNPGVNGQPLTYEEGLALLEDEERLRKQVQGWEGAYVSAVGSTINGIPIAGPIIKGAIDRGAAGLSSLIYDQPYSDQLERVQSVGRVAQEEHPYVTTAGNVTGTVGGTIPMVLAAPAAFGTGAASLGLRMLVSGLSGLTLSAADTAVRSGGNLDEVKQGAGWGAALGVLGPAIGPLAGKTARAAVDWLGNRAAAKAAGTNTGTVAKIFKMLSGDDLDEMAMRTRLADLGPESMLLDLGPTVRGRAEALAASRGRARDVLQTALDERQAGAKARIDSVADETMGRKVVPSWIENGIEANQLEVGAASRDAFSNARPFDFNPVAGELDRQIWSLRGDPQDALREVRGMLNKYGTQEVDMNPATAFNTREAIDGLLEAETNSKVVSALTGARQVVDDGLARAVPQIKEFDAMSAELARQRAALNRGQTVLSDGRTSLRPDELAREVQEGALPHGLQIGPSAVPFRLSQGARAEVERILGSNINDLQRLHELIVTKGDWNRSRLAMLFGQEKADRLFRTLEAERNFAATRDAVVPNGAAARGTPHMADAAGETGAFIRNALAADGSLGGLRAAGIKTLDKIGKMMAQGYREASNAHLAEALASNRASLVDAVARQYGLPKTVPMADTLAKSVLFGNAKDIGDAVGPVLLESYKDIKDTAGPVLLDAARSVVPWR